MDFFQMFSLVFFIFSYWNFDIGIIVLRSSISVQVSKKIFGIINKRGGVQISIACLGGGRRGCVEKHSKNNKPRGWGTFIWKTRVNTSILIKVAYHPV